MSDVYDQPRDHQQLPRRWLATMLPPSVAFLLVLVGTSYGWPDRLIVALIGAIFGTGMLVIGYIIADYAVLQAGAAAEIRSAPDRRPLAAGVLFGVVMFAAGPSLLAPSGDWLGECVAQEIEAAYQDRELRPIFLRLARASPDNYAAWVGEQVVGCAEQWHP